ncbi:hypothetical protein [Nonomuraea sp. NPDC001831]|uniref:hypothetical protein n=1 Tax=Nonomuraea sp. NPDC001831 TaxID=3364340 RepID=UPI0036B3E9E4
MSTTPPEGQIEQNLLDVARKELSTGEAVAVYLRSARNVEEFPLVLLEHFSAATEVHSHEVKHSQDGASLELCRYDAIKYEVLRGGSGSRSDKARPRVEIRVPVTTTAWALVYQQESPHPSRPYIFYEPTAAVAAHSYLLAEMLKVKDLQNSEDIRNHMSELLSMQYLGVVDPSSPVRPAQVGFGITEVMNTDALEREAAALRIHAAGSPQVMKDLAVELYREGEHNIRHISRVTGLSRDTIYFALYAEGLKSFAHSNVIEGIENDIRAGRLKDGELAPSAQDIASQWSLSLDLAKKVLAILRVKGALRFLPGHGTVIDNRFTLRKRDMDLREQDQESPRAARRSDEYTHNGGS